MIDNCAVKADSINPLDGSRLTTILFNRFPFSLIQEIGTHRGLNPCSTFESIIPFDPSASRSSGSSRAIPTKKVIESIKADPYIPTFTRNQRGMQGGELDRGSVVRLEILYRQSMQQQIAIAEQMAEAGAHKQEVNRVLTPYLRIPILCTGNAASWHNFFNLRCHESAHPDFQEQANSALKLWAESTPVILSPGEWHMPFGDDELVQSLEYPDAQNVCAARNARLSYSSHDGDHSLESHLKLCAQLVTAEPKHSAPFEHVAQVVEVENPDYHRNFGGHWRQYRSVIDSGSALLGWIVGEK